jgi:troponin T
MQRRRAQQQFANLDEAAQELLAQNKIEREQLAKDIEEMRSKCEKRRKEREEEEKRLTQVRAEEDARRKAEEEDRKKKKEEEERVRREERAMKTAELDKMRNMSGRNFVITKKEGGGFVEVETEEEGGLPKKSKEELEAEKKAILAQRIQPLDTSGYDSGKLAEKAKELYSQLVRLEGDKYDLEKRFKEMQRDMLELAEKARQVNKVGKEGQLKRIGMTEEGDKIQEKFAGAPSKIVMYSEYERQKDKRPFDDRRGLFKGPVFGFPAERIPPAKTVKWDDATGQPIYLPLGGGGGEEGHGHGEEVAAEAEE